MVKKMITTIKERRWMKEKENGNRLRTRKEIKEFGGYCEANNLSNEETQFMMQESEIRVVEVEVVDVLVALVVVDTAKIYGDGGGAVVAVAYRHHVYLSF